MSDIFIRASGRTGRITLARPDALNALTYAMCKAIEAALDQWNDEASVELIILDAEGTRAFCAGGDIVEMHQTGARGDAEYGRRFWRDEYRLNAKLANSKLPVVSFLQGYTMGGGVGIGCHVSHRIVGESSQIAMPECAIGLIPDVGGSYLLGRAPGRIGECMGVTGLRAGPADALHAGFADNFVRQEHWPDLIGQLTATGDAGAIEHVAETPPAGALEQHRHLIDRVFALTSMPDIIAALGQDGSDFAAAGLKWISRNSPLSMACALALIRMQRSVTSIEQALGHEYRFVYRSVRDSDFLEGIRALVIDKDNKPDWRHKSADRVSRSEVEALLAPLGDCELRLETGN